jgi:hypothetical protein
VNRRRRFDVFFIMYLTAILGFLLISHQRSKTNTEIEQKAYNIARTFLPSLRMEFESDTLCWYVDADDRTGEIISGNAGFTARLFVHDIGMEDSVTVTAISYTRNDTLRYDSTVQVAAMRSAGDPDGRIVVFPFTCNIKRTGVYRFTFHGKAKRVHLLADGSLQYHAIKFPRGLLADTLIQNLETSFDTLTAVVRDTSVAAPASGEALTLRASNQVLSTAIGFEVSNMLVANVGWKTPKFRIVRGGGRLEQVASGMREVSCSWKGQARFANDTVVVEARIDRGAGGRDFAKTSFVLNAVTPTLEEPLPAVLYAGEEASLAIKVRGLDNASAYRWMFDNVAGTGSHVVMRVPSDYDGRVIRLAATYDGRPYPYRDASRHTSGQSVFYFPVVTPPVHIAFSPPDHPSWRTVFTFTAARYSDAVYTLAAPVRDLSQVRLHAVKKDGSPIRFDLNMVRNGLFAFSIEGAENLKGETFVVTITIGETSISRTITFRNE